MNGRTWLHTCLTCSTVFYGSHFAIVCPTCKEAGRGRACGRCYLCGTKVPFHPQRRFNNKGFLFCRNCARERRRESKRTYRHRFEHTSGIVVPATYEEKDLL